MKRTQKFSPLFDDSLVWWLVSQRLPPLHYRPIRIEINVKLQQRNRTTGDGALVPPDRTKWQ